MEKIGGQYRCGTVGPQSELRSGVRHSQASELVAIDEEIKKIVPSGDGQHIIISRNNVIRGALSPGGP